VIDKINFIDKSVLLKLNEWSVHLSLFVNKFFAEYLTYSIPIILLVVFYWEQKAKKPAMRAFFSAMLAWPILGNILGHLINRPRPFDAGGVKEIIFHRPTYSFPSDHAAALFAIAFSFWLSGYKKLSISLFIMATAISFFRISTAIHWPTDIIGGIIVGLFAAWLIDLFDRPLDIFYNLILKILRVIRLA